MTYEEVIALPKEDDVFKSDWLDGYEQGEKEGVIKFVDNLIGEINAYNNAGHSLDVIAFSKNYINQYL